MKRFLGVLTFTFIANANANDAGLVVPKGFIQAYPNQDVALLGTPGHNDKTINGRQSICTDFLEEEKKINGKIELILNEMAQLVPMKKILSVLEKNNLMLELLKKKDTPVSHIAGGPYEVESEEGLKAREALLTALSQVFVQENIKGLPLVAKLGEALDEKTKFSGESHRCEAVFDEVLRESAFERINALQKRLNQNTEGESLKTEFDVWIAEKEQEIKKAIAERRVMDIEVIKEELKSAATLPWQAEKGSLLRRLEPHQKIHIEQRSKAVLEQLALKTSTSPLLDKLETYMKAQLVNAQKVEE